MIINYEKIRNILELLRISNSLSQRQLGTCLGISKSKIHDLESGKQVVNYNDLNKYSKFFHVPITYIIFNDDIDLTKSKIQCINEISQNIKKYKHCKIYTIDEKEILKKILNKYEVELKNKSTLNKILESINEDKPDKPGDIRIIKRMLKNNIKFKYLKVFISVLNISMEELF